MAAALPAPQQENGPKADLSHLRGVDKAAIMLLSLGEESKKILALLDEDEIKELSSAMATLGHVPAPVVETLSADFLQELHGSGAIVGSYEHTQRLLSQFLDPERVDALMEEVRGPAGRNIWDKLANVNEEVLAAYLKNEFPQTIAVVLSKVRQEHAAKVLSKLPDELAAEAILRMLAMEPVQREIIEKIENTLRTEFMSNLARSSRRDPHETMADIFNSFDRQTEARFLNALEGRSRENADRIRSLMFVFEDLKKLDQAGVQTLMRGVDKTDLALALKGAHEDMRKKFISSMSERGGKLLREEMASMGPVRLRDVEAAQARMVNIAKDLAASGEIVLSDGKNDDEMIY